MQSFVHFSKIKDEIIEQLLKANQSIQVAVAWLTDEDIIRTLTRKANSGVNIQVVISESKENFRNISKWKDYLRFGGKLYIATPKFLHNKFCIIDSRTIINGSYNWTYFARGNEENIMVHYLDCNISEDNKLLFTFETKYNFFCDKSSKRIQDISELSQFKEQGKVAFELLTQLDEQEIQLRQELEDDVKKSFDEAIKIGISISTLLFDRMKYDGGGVEFIKRILHDEINSGEMKSGFKKLEEPIPHRVDLSLEYLVSRQKYQKLFTEIEVNFCKKLMSKYNL